MKTNSEKSGVHKTGSDNSIFSSRIHIPCVVDEFVQNGADEAYVNVFPSLMRRKYIDGRGVEFVPTERVEEVPIAYHSTQLYANTTPLQKGDRGWLVHSDYDLDLWNIEGEEISETDNTRFKDLNDCWFVPGMWPRPKGMCYSMDWHEMRDVANLTRVAINSEFGVHLQHEDWQLMLSRDGFEVWAGDTEFLTNLILLFEQRIEYHTEMAGIATGLATNHNTMADGWGALVLEPPLQEHFSGVGNKPAYSAAESAAKAAASAEEARAEQHTLSVEAYTAALEALMEIRGAVLKPERDPCDVFRP